MLTSITRIYIFFCCGVLCLTVWACNPPAQQESEDTSAEIEAPTSEFTDLLEGNTMAAWRNFNEDTISDKWEVTDGVLMLTGKGGGDIITRNQYKNFELELEWKISENGNSGIFFHVMEGDSLEKVYHTGPEMQVLDNDGHKDGKIHKHRSGDNYDLHACSVETVKAVGEWNQVRLIVDKGHVEHWLNGTKVVEYQLGSPEWEELYQASKFTKWPMYGRAGKGHLALQDHGDVVWFRNIRAREL